MLISIIPPTRPSRKKYALKSLDGKHDLVFQFISNKYLRLKVGREVVLGHPGPFPESAPEVFEFVGMLRNLMQEEREGRLERERRMREWEIANRSPSPREDWF
jgi:hypothetical protein